MIGFIIGLFVGAILGAVTICLMVASKDQPGTWHRTSKQLPEMEDVDKFNRVWAYNAVTRSCSPINWELVVMFPGTYTGWCRTPGEPGEDEGNA